MDLPNTSSKITTTASSIENQNQNQNQNQNHNQNRNHNQHADPFSDPALPPLSLLAISTIGTALVTNVTKYLSTLPHPIEVVEELIAVVAVTSSLLTSLHTTISRFPHFPLSPTHSFITPLCHDTLFAFKQLEYRVQEARRMRVFEPNDVGLVRLPRAAWCLVLGTEQKVNALRSRLYVEKYRIRVLIEAVAYEGLRTLRENGGVWGRREEEEFKGLRRMLPLIAERLVGVQRDYRPRLMRLNGQVPDEKLVEEQQQQQEIIARAANVRNVVVQAPLPTTGLAPQAKTKEAQKPCDEKAALRSSKSTDSLASTSSSVTTIDDSLLETWLLRCNRPKKDLQSRTSILGLPLLSKHTFSAVSYYVKPVLASASETHATLTECQGPKSAAQHIAQLNKKVLSMDDDAQWEIQKLCEARENACSNEKVKREWSVVGLLERNRRLISHSAAGKKWWKRSEKPITEFVLILKGETADHSARVLPVKHADPWKPKNPPAQTTSRPAAAVAVAQGPAQQVLMPVQRQVGPVQQGTVLRHVENRRVLSAEEAEGKMREIVGELFVLEQGEGDESDDEEETDEDESEIEDDSEDEVAVEVEREEERKE